jgi:hypothetical protein
MIEWQSNPPEEPMNWYKAMEYAESLGNGWRLPTRSELIDAYDNKVKNFIFMYYWSSSTYDQNTNRAWRLVFDDGGVGNNDKTISYYVRCVREIGE